jgi:anti-sigma-K factor RskA
MNAIDIHALAGAYALDALTDLERVAFARHMSSCPTCELEVAELRETAARLVEPVAATPPPGLRAAVLAEISRTPQERSARHARTSSPGSATRWRRWTAAAVAAGIIAAGGGAATWIVENQRVHDAQSQLVAITDILNAPDARILTKQLPRGGVLTVVASARMDTAVVLLDGAPEQPADKAYQLWKMMDRTAEPLPVLAPKQTSAIIRIDRIRTVNEIGLTVEPARGSTTPTIDTLVAKLPLH